MTTIAQYSFKLRVLEHPQHPLFHRLWTIYKIYQSLKHVLPSTSAYSSEFNLLILTLGQFFINLGIPMRTLS